MVWLRNLILPAALALLAALANAHGDEPFYKGKRLTLLINFAIGGPADVEGRLFAKYIGRHIDGNPSVVVQNMDGAGGIVGAKYLGTRAQRRHHGRLPHRNGLHVHARSGTL